MLHETQIPAIQESLGQPELQRNLNDTVLVKVTPDGERIWDESMADVLATFPQQEADYLLQRDAEGYTRLPLHEVMRVFGGKAMPVGMGSPIEAGFRFLNDN